MSRQAVDQFFSEYVFGFMFSDIQREIDLAKSGCNGGNFLAALGLLCYTEVLGSIKETNFPTLKKPNEKNNFDGFFADLDVNYQAFARTLNAYDVFRCGMAHEYLVKKNCTIAMLKGDEVCGIGRNTDGSYYFVVERYFEDFMKACRALHESLKKLPNPSLPK